MNYIDLFAGCGGLSLGLYNAGWHGLFAIEKSPDAFKTLEHNLIKTRNHFNWPEWLPKKPHDIKKVIETYSKQLKALRGTVDMVTGGPPCQGFSTAGLRKETDARNKLIDSYINFIGLVEPKILFFENVKGFTMEFEKNGKKSKRYSDYAISRLKELGYDVHPELINFSEYGIPQKRCRFILVGIRKDVAKAKKIAATHFFEQLKANREKFLVNKGLEISVSLEEAISDLLKTHGTKQSEEFRRFKMGLYGPAQSKYQKYLRGKLTTTAEPDSHRFANHSPEIEKRFKLITKYTTPGKNISDETKMKLGIKKRNVIALNSKDSAPTITTLPDDFIHYGEARILTVREYCRIQSFPDNYEIKAGYTTGGKRRKKDVPRYTQIGNAIPPLFGEQSGFILNAILE
ncbi:MAG TPA: DNA cytosine methyltransferase [Chitinophagales bacterium]|nr:DNA cytosine methyltransferase [Chitinophagales bacterium]